MVEDVKRWLGLHFYFCVLENVSIARILLDRLLLLTTTHQGLNPYFLIGFQHEVKLVLATLIAVVFAHLRFSNRLVNSTAFLKSLIVFLL